MSDAAKITATPNGPYKVENIKALTTSDGAPAETKPLMFLCRCGLSANKPFCDGSHSREGWTE